MKKNIDEKKLESSILINKENISELSFLLETMETYIENGGEILIPKVISINDFKGKFVGKDKESFGYVLETEKNHKDIFKSPESIFLSFVVKPKKD